MTGNCLPSFYRKRNFHSRASGVVIFQAAAFARPHSRFSRTANLLASNLMFIGFGGSVDGVDAPS
jgi:hypothetical protein